MRQLCSCVFLLLTSVLGADWNLQLSSSPSEEDVFCEAHAEQLDELSSAIESLSYHAPCYYRVSESCFSVWSGWAPTQSTTYERPENASNVAWETVQPYLFARDSLISKKLDIIFNASRATADRESLLAAGFELTPDQGLHVVVAFHKELKGYLIKVVLDKYDPNNEGKGEDWQQWVQRITGENIIRKGISELDYKGYFKVPRQWIYPLPNRPKCPELENYFPKSFILIVEDMKLVEGAISQKFYRRMGKKLMDAIFVITTKYGLSDCCNRHNLPLCKDGRLAFVDTETFNRWPVNYQQMLQYISLDARPYWKKLQEQGGPKKK